MCDASILLMKESCDLRSWEYLEEKELRASSMLPERDESQ